jgi:glucosamine 6-phosphate synthetase-like amidotransferase/phosphosugar isomerase protein
MCGIFGQISKNKINKDNFEKLVKHSEQRGIDSSGLVYLQDERYKISRADYNIEKLLNKAKPYECKIVLGHSRLITNGLGDNQPVIRNNICAIHNGIIVNEKEVWEKLTVERKYKIDSEVIVAIAEEEIKNNIPIEDIPNKILSTCRGVVACALVLSEYGKLLLFSNNGSLYVGYIEEDIYFASERYALDQIKCKNIRQIKNEALILEIPSTKKEFIVIDETSRTEDLIPEFKFNQNE